MRSLPPHWSILCLEDSMAQQIFPRNLRRNASRRRNWQFLFRFSKTNFLSSLGRISQKIFDARLSISDDGRWWWLRRLYGRITRLVITATTRDVTRATPPPTTLCRQLHHSYSVSSLTSHCRRRNVTKYSERFVTSRWWTLLPMSPLMSVGGPLWRTVIHQTTEKQSAGQSISRNVGQSKSHMR